MQPYSSDSAHLADSPGAFPEGAGTADDSRRADPDRRRAPTPRFSFYALFGGRRAEVRREDEREGSFVDRYRRGVVLLIAWTALMNVGDSLFTLIHLQSGGIELNPVADYLLKTGRVGFVLTKAFFITLALLVLVLHKNFALARWGLFVAAGTYTLLNLYHLSLFF